MILWTAESDLLYQHAIIFIEKVPTNAKMTVSYFSSLSLLLFLALFGTNSSNEWNVNYRNHSAKVYSCNCLKTSLPFFAIEPQDSRAHELNKSFLASCSIFWMREYSFIINSIDDIDQILDLTSILPLADMLPSIDSLFSFNHVLNRIEIKYEHRKPPAVISCSLIRGNCFKQVKKYQHQNMGASSPLSTSLSSFVLLSEISFNELHSAISDSAMLATVSKKLIQASQIIHLFIFILPIDGNLNETITGTFGGGATLSDPDIVKQGWNKNLPGSNEKMTFIPWVPRKAIIESFNKHRRRPTRLQPRGKLVSCVRITGSSVLSYILPCEVLWDKVSPNLWRSTNDWNNSRYSSFLQDSTFLLLLPRNDSFLLAESILKEDTISGNSSSSFRDCNDLDSVQQIPVIVEAIMAGAIPVIVDFCLQQFIQRSSKDIGDEHSLPIINLNQHQAARHLRNRKIFELFLQKEFETMSKKDFNIAGFHLSHWLSLILPFELSDRHISRGITKHNQFLTKLLTMPNEQSTKFVSENERKRICSYTSVGSSQNLLSTNESDSRLKLKKNKRLSVEIVIPRCCESSKGDLLWLESVMKAVPSWMVSVYYKCPFCIPENKVVEWSPTIFHSNNSKSPLLSSMIYERGGGIKVIDEIYKGNRNKVHEHMAFDLEVNGKEATAYLQHIVGRYDSLADVTIFLHTQPAHHLDFDRLFRVFDYLIQCRVTTELLKPDYMYLNYRWMQGDWAHDPPECVLNMLEFAFLGSPILGDSKRFKDIWKADLKQFLSTNMAAGAAAQFLVSREAIQRRSQSWWQKLLDVNRGTPSIKGCNHRDYKKGTEVASAMERLWHNFFKDGLQSSNPLFLPSAGKDTTLPAYLAFESVHSGFQDEATERQQNTDNRKEHRLSKSFSSSSAAGLKKTRKRQMIH